MDLKPRQVNSAEEAEPGQRKPKFRRNRKLYGAGLPGQKPERRRLKRAANPKSRSRRKKRERDRAEAFRDRASRRDKPDAWQVKVHDDPLNPSAEGIIAGPGFDLKPAFGDNKSW